MCPLLSRSAPRNGSGAEDGRDRAPGARRGRASGGARARAPPSDRRSRSEPRRRRPRHRPRSRGRGVPSTQTNVRSAAMLIGPCRYSIAGYASVYERVASRSLSAASSAMPTLHPWPRKTKCAARDPRTEVGSSERHLGRRDHRAEILAEVRAEQTRGSTSRTASARPTARRRTPGSPSDPAADAAGDPGTAVISERGRAVSRSRSVDTSGRRAAPADHDTRSYARPAGNSEAGNASVSPWPRASRRRANARAM